MIVWCDEMIVSINPLQRTNDGCKGTFDELKAQHETIKVQHEQLQARVLKKNAIFVDYPR